MKFEKRWKEIHKEIYLYSMHTKFAYKLKNLI